MTLNPQLIESYRFHKREALGYASRVPITAGYLIKKCGVEPDQAQKTAQRESALALEKARCDLAAGMRRYTSGIYSYPGGRQGTDNESAFFETLEQGGFRFIGYADEISRSIHHKGWFADEDQDSTLRGCALQIPGRNGKARFLAAYQDSENDGYVVDLATVYEEDSRQGSHWDSAKDFDAARDAARSGDSMAEKAAEKEREYLTAWRAGSNYAAKGEEVKELRQEALAILAERRAVAGVTAPTLCDVIRARVESILESIAELRKEREQLSEGDFDNLIFWPGDKSLAAAFNEGAEESVIG